MTLRPVVVVYRGGHGALGVARTLGRLDVPVYLVAQDGMASPLLASRYWRRIVRWDFRSPEEASVAFLLDLGRELEREHDAPPLLLTLADWVAIFIERHADALGERFVFPLAPEPVVHRLADKWQMTKLAEQHGIPTPTTIYPRTRGDVEAFLAAVPFPIVLKPADPSVEGAATKRICNTRDELLAQLEPRLADGEPNVILQEYIPGDATTVWMCNAYLARDGSPAAIFTGRKLRQVSSTGIASLAVCLPNPMVAAQTGSFMQAVGYRGCVGIGYRYDARDGRYKLLDVNPRVSGVFRLFAGTDDVDVVRLCYRDFAALDLPSTALREGRKWILEDDLIAAYRELRAGRLTIRAWRETVRGVREAQWFAADDPLPLLFWLRDGVRGRIAAASRRFRGPTQTEPAASPGEPV